LPPYPSLDDWVVTLHDFRKQIHGLRSCVVNSYLWERPKSDTAPLSTRQPAENIEGDRTSRPKLGPEALDPRIVNHKPRALAADKFG